MTTYRLACVGALTAALLGASAYGQGSGVPEHISFTANLNGSGSPLTGPHDFVFTLFDASSGGSQAWTETWTALPVTSGMVYAELGTTTPLTPTILNGAPLYLEISVDGTAMAPRLPIVSVPYAIRAGVANSAEKLGGLLASEVQHRVAGSCASGAISAIDSDGGVTCSVPAGGGTITAINTLAGSGLTGGTASGAADLSLAACGANKVLKSVGSSWACADDNDTLYNAAAGGGLALGGGNGFSIDASGCTASGQILKYVGPGWACTNENAEVHLGDVVSVGATANGGLVVGGSGPAPTLGLPSGCAANTVMKSDGTSWSCGAVSVSLLSDVTGQLPIANGGTGASTGAAALAALGGAASGANGDITALTGLTTALSVAQGGTGSTVQNFIDLATSQTIGGNKIFRPTTNVAGVTVRQTNSASPTANIFEVQDTTGLSTYLKVNSAGAVSWTGTATGSISGSAGSFSGVLAGDVTGAQASTVVSGIQGVGVSANVPVANQVLRYNGVKWIPDSVALGTDVSGLLPVASGGTGAASAGAARAVLGAAASGANSDITSLSGLTTALNIAQGGTGSTTASGALGTLGAAASGANSDITSLTGLTTALTLAQGGTGSTTAVGARGVLSAAASGANGDITSLTGLTTALSIGQGGTGSAIQNFVDLATAQTIGGNKVFRPSTNVAGVTVRQTSSALPLANIFEVQDTTGITTYLRVNNAGAVSWTGTATGNVSGSAGSFSGALAGDVTGTQAATTVAGIRGIGVSATAPVANQLLRYSGANWTPGAVALATDVSGQLPVGSGGTGASTPAAARTALGAAVSGINGDITQLTGLTTALSLSQGGTGSTTAAGARGVLSAAASGVNADITQLSGLTTALSLAQGGTGSTTAAGARGVLGAAVSGVNGDITQLTGLTTALSVAQGGTGSTTAAGARGALSAAVSGVNGDITQLTGLTTALSIGQGGTGSSVKNFVDLTTGQTIDGTKTFAPTTNISGVIVKQTSFAGPSADIFAVQNAPATISHLRVDNVGDVRVNNNLWFGTQGAMLAGSNQGGSLELGPTLGAGQTPFIDFHYGVGFGQDYNTRLQNDADGQLSLSAAAGTANLNVIGNATVKNLTRSGTIRLGSETGSSPPTAAAEMIVRTAFAQNSVDLTPVAKTNVLTLERDGTNAGFKILNAGTGNENLVCTGTNALGASFVVVKAPLVLGTTTVFTDAIQNIVYFDCTFGYPWLGGYMTKVSMFRQAGDNWWEGYITSNFNQ